MLEFVIVFVGVFVFATAPAICAAITEKTTGEKNYSGYNGIADPHPGQKINNSIWDSIW